MMKEHIFLYHEPVFPATQIHNLILEQLMVSIALGRFLITSKASDARRRGATTEAYEAIRRKKKRALAGLRLEGNAA
jgi:hypothetical protein